MPKHNLACLALIIALLPFCAARAQSGDGQFGCPGRTQFFANTDLQFVPLAQNSIEQWKARPALAFDGFDEKKYGFHQIALYRWRAPLQSDSQNNDDAGQTASQNMYRVQLAVRLIVSHGDTWFELATGGASRSAPDELLYIQGADSGSDQDRQAEALAQSFSIRPATPNPALPLLLLEFSYNNGPAGAVSNRLLLDLRGGRPQISKTVQCMDSESSSGGVCDSPTRLMPKNLRCTWEAAIGDFHCAMTSPFGAENSARLARRDFYLFTSRPAPANWYPAQPAPNLGVLAVQFSRNGTGTSSVAMVPEFGPVTLLAHYKDLLPGTEQFVFASPGAGDRLNTHFSLVTVSPDGRAKQQAVPKWVLSGEKTDEDARPRGYTPLPNDDRYHISALEDRTGFHSFQVVMTAMSSAASEQLASGPTHVIYWVGIEAVEGKLVPSAVRVAGEGAITASCAQEAREGTAISVEPQHGMAAATVHVRSSGLPGDSAAAPTDEADATSGCVWIGGLYWKTATGFQVRKIDDDCEAGVTEISISEDGRIVVRQAHAPDER